MAKTTKSKQKSPDGRKEFAAAEYARLIACYKAAGVDELKLEIDDRLIRKVAELFGILEAIKDMPTVRYNPATPEITEETAAGKVRVKYMAQYTASMLKLNKDLLGVVDPGDDGDGDGLNEFED